MNTLKDLRINAGWSQFQLAEKISSSQALISAYELGSLMPDLEICLILEKQFGQPIQWKENHTPQQKQEVLQALSELAEAYPLPVVAEFIARMYRRSPHADKLIKSYASLTNTRGEAPLFPPK